MPFPVTYHYMPWYSMWIEGPPYHRIYFAREIDMTDAAVWIKDACCERYLDDRRLVNGFSSDSDSDYFDPGSDWDWFGGP